MLSLLPIHDSIHHKGNFSGYIRSLCLLCPCQPGHRIPWVASAVGPNLKDQRFQSGPNGSLFLKWKWWWSNTVCLCLVSFHGQNSQTRRSTLTSTCLHASGPHLAVLMMTKIVQGMRKIMWTMLTSNVGLIARNRWNVISVGGCHANASRSTV